ncbi:TonB-dependent receptor [Flavobacterium rivuli WB 3.3-2 = DSM 21788]|uniref:TonB-dependent receptor n=1 Tax=Flavobacterium rivuli WB 3.3-2 = DSM 21788 TaxID=1121895 RepID=A0A0A2M3M4_9FLAO|nr:TonB-dependent receptor [Flavobacterium rivuli]KGO87222.1 TonB-dependent receptor [Flavobacterium rivuli WB 3.3-2 = DSM 21788]
MKTMYQRLLFLLLMLPFSVLAQSTLTGVVRDNTTGEPIPGVNVIVQGTPNGTATDLDGKYTIGNVKSGDNLVFSSIGFATQTVAYSGQPTLDVVLKDDATQLQEVVVIGYGTTTKKDATGAITTVTSKDFNKGAISSADQLLTGRAPGVRITSAGGQPDAAPNIRIRGGSSLSAQNNPLIIIDGVPLDFVNPAGVNNPLSLINPNDIESFTILKDASATAIYGSRASNGVIIVTTKKGSSGAPQYTFSSTVSIGKVTKQLDVMDGPTFSRFIQQYYPGQVSKLGIADPNAPAGTVDDPLTPNIIEGRILSNTNWQDAIYRTSILTDHNFSARANLFKKVPFRASVGYTNNEGVVKTNDYERYTASLKITPTFFDDHLKVDINAKGLRAQKNTIDDGGAIGGALNMDPTKPIYATGTANNFGGYYQNVTAANPQDFDGQYNPVNLLDQRRRPENVNKLLGNVQLDYKMHFLPELRAIVNAGFEGSRAKITENYGEYAFASYQLNNQTGNYIYNPGINYREEQHISNKTLDTYLAYTKTFNGFISRIDAQAGHTFQSFVNDGNKEIYRYNTDTGIREITPNVQNPNNRYYNKTVLESYFGRANVDLASKYLFTFTMRADGSSLFRKDKRWGYFPAAGFAWRAIDEKFLKDSKVVTDLKVRLGYGQTGQQDITGIAGYYPTSALFSIGATNSQYLPGVNTYSANPFNDQLKWEVTTTYNAGIDFAFFKNDVLSGSVDVYRRDTDDLLVKSFVPSGQYLTNEITQNVGSLTNRGIEVNLKVRAITTDDFTWEILGNLAYNKGKVTDLNNVNSIEASESGLPVQTGLKLARHAVGQQPYSAYVFEQLYDASGHPIVGAYKDRNGDGVITNDDKYYQPLRPNYTFGFSTNFTYKDFDLSATFHGQFDGKVYNAIKLAGGYTERVLPNNTNNLNNALNFYSGAADPSFQTINGNVPASDYFLESAAFLRCDNITLGYRIKNITKTGTLRLYAGVNNAFIIKSYSGQDPENFNAIDSNFYPRPRMYNFGLNFDF